MPVQKCEKLTDTFTSSVPCPVCQYLLKIHVNTLTKTITAISCFACPWSCALTTLQTALASISFSSPDAPQFHNNVKALSDILYYAHIGMSMGQEKGA